MKKFLTVWGLLLFISITSYSQEKKYALYSVAFYNLENLLIQFMTRAKTTLNIYQMVKISGTP